MQAQATDTSIKNNVMNVAVASSRTQNSPYDILARAGWLLASKTGHVLNGNGAQVDNIFTFTKNCDIMLYAEVTAVTNSTTLSGVFLQTDDGTIQNPLSDSMAPPDFSGCAVGAWLAKMSSYVNPLNTNLATASGILESANASFTSLYPIVICAKNGVTNYIQFGFTGDANTNVTASFYCWYRGLGGGSVISV